MNVMGDQTARYFAEMREVRRKREEQVPPAKAALKRLVDVMAAKTGQGYKLRALLYSLWNGKPAPLIDILCLDWPIREDLMRVLGAFGFESSWVSFFYDDIKNEVTSAGLFEWFIEEGDK